MSFTTSVTNGLDTTLPQAVIDRQSDANLRLVALSAFAALAPGMDTVEGSFAFDLIEPFCLVLAQAYTDLIDVERRNSLATATGLDLDRIGDLYAVSRGPATNAIGTVTFNGASGSTIPAGTTVTTQGPNAQIFQTDVDAQIPTGGATGTVDVPATAYATGPNGNVPAGGIKLFGGTPPTGLTSVTNNAPFTGGANVQQDGPLNQYYTGYRSDIYLLENTRGEGGAAKHLRKWARSVNGVGGVHVQEISPAPGWATVVLLGTDGRPASADLVHQVESAILDPHYIYNEAESSTFLLNTLGGTGASIVSLADATPLSGTNNAVRMLGASGSIVQQRVDNMLPQPGVWRLKPRCKVSSTANATNLVTMVMYDLDAGLPCWTRPNNSGASSQTTFAANRFSTAFISPDVDPITVDFAWNGISRIELRITLAGGDTTTSLYFDQINYFATMSRDDRDVGLSPAGMRVNVIPALPITVNITATITYALTTGQTISMVNSSIATNLQNHFAQIAFSADETVRRAAVEQVIYTTGGVGDVSNVQLNGATNNIQIGPTQVAVIGTLNWTQA